MRQVLMQRGNHIFIRYCASESVFAGFRRIAKLATSIAIAVAFSGIALPTSSAQAQTARFSVTGQFTPGQTTFAENEEASFILRLDGFPDDQDIATAEVELVVQQITTGFSAPQGNTFEGTFFDIAVEGDNSRAVTLSVGGGSNNRMKAIVAFDPDDSTAGIGQPAVITWTIRPKDIASTQTFRIRRTNNGRVVLKNSAGVAVSRLAPTFLENFTITPVIAEDAVFVTYTYQNGDTIPNIKREEPTNTSEVGVGWNSAVGINLIAGKTARYSDGTAYECDAASSGNCQIRFPGGQIANGGPVNATFPEESAPPAPTIPTPPPPVAEPQDPRLIYTYENLAVIPVGLFKSEEPTNASDSGITWTEDVSLAITHNSTATYSDGTTYECLSSGGCVITFASRQINNGGQVRISQPFDTAAQFLPDTLGAEITFNSDSKITNRESSVAGGRLPAPHTASISESAGDVAVFDVTFSGIPDNVTRAQCVYGLGGTAQYKDEGGNRDYALLNAAGTGVIELTDGNFFAEANINEGDLPTPQDQEDAIDGVNHRFTVDCGSTNANASWKTDTYTREIRIYDDSTDEEAESIAIFLRQVNLFVGTNGTDELGSVRLPPRETVSGEIVVLPDTLLLTINDNDAPAGLPEISFSSASISGRSYNEDSGLALFVLRVDKGANGVQFDYSLSGTGVTAGDLFPPTFPPGGVFGTGEDQNTTGPNGIKTQAAACAAITDGRCGVVTLSNTEAVTVTTDSSNANRITIEAIGDDLAETNETVTLTLYPRNDDDGNRTSIFPNFNTIADRSRTFIITDDDTAPPTATLSGDASVTESVGRPNITINLSSATTATLGYRITGIEEADLTGADAVSAGSGGNTTLVADSDGDVRTGTFTISGTSGSLNVDVADDNVLEGTETFTLTLYAGHPSSTRRVLAGATPVANVGSFPTNITDSTPVTARLSWPGTAFREGDVDRGTRGREVPISPGPSIFPEGGALEGASPHILLDLRNSDDGSTVTVARDMFFPITCTTLGGCGAAATPAARRALEAQIERTIDDKGTTRRIGPANLDPRRDDEDLYGVVLRAGQSQEGVGVDLLNDERFGEGDEVLILTSGTPTGFRSVASPVAPLPTITTETARITIRNRDTAAQDDAVTWHPESQDSTQDVTTGAGAVRTKVSELVLELAGGFTGDHQAVSVVYRYETNTGGIPDASLGSLEWWVLNLADGSRLRRLAIGDVSGSISDVITVSRALFSPIQDGTPTVRVGLFFSPTAAPGVGGDLVLNVKNVKHIDGITGTSDRVMCSDNPNDNPLFVACDNQAFNVGESLVELTADRTASEAGSETGSVTFRFAPLNMAGNPVYPTLATSANVPYSIGGTATRGQTTSDGDYVLTMRTSSDEAGNTLTTGITFSDEAITIPGDNRTDYITFIVTPNTDGVNERDETVIITIGSTDPGITFTASPAVVRFARASTITIANQRVVTISFASGAETNFRVQEGNSGQTTPGAGSRNIRTNQNSPKARLIVENVPADAGGYIHYVAVRSQVTSGSATYGGGTTGDGTGGAANSDYMLARGFSLSPTQWITQDSTIYVDRSTQMGPNPQTNRLQDIFNPGSNQFNLDFWAVTAADTLDEPPETINMRFSVSIERCIARGTCSPGTDRETVGGAAVINATFTMNDEDSLVRSLVIQSVSDRSADSVAEGETMDVELLLNDTVLLGGSQNFAYTITDATNAANTDNAAGFVAADLDNPALATGNLTVRSGGSLSRFETMRFTIADDAIPEGAETLRVTLAPNTYTGTSGTERSIAIGEGSSYADFTIAASDGGGGPTGSIVDISSRSQAVQDAILADDAVTSADPTAVSAAELAEITELDFTPASILPNPGDFDGLTGLITLRLSGGQWGEVYLGTFDGLTSLRTLNLGTNALTALPAGILDDLTNLRTLTLENNVLTDLRSDTFDNLTNLSTLHLHGNALTRLPADLFSATPEISELTLQANPFTPEIGLPIGVFDNILGNLGTITTTYNPEINNFQIDDAVRRAHFVCQRDATDLVTNTDGVDDCLRITAEQFAAYTATRFSASGDFAAGLSVGTGAVRTINESAGSALSASSNVGVAAFTRTVTNVPGTPLSYTCVINVSGTATYGEDWFIKDDVNFNGTPDEDIDGDDDRLEGAANDSGTRGTYTEPNCGPGATATLNIRIINDTAVEPGGETIIFTLASVQAFDAANSGGNSLGFANVVAGTAGSTTLTITIVDDEVATGNVNISGRTQGVQDAILADAAVTSEVATAVALSELAQITRLDPNVSAVAVGDFANLPNLQTLALSGNDLPALPNGVFAGLSRLEVLWMSRNSLTTLHADVFDPLVNLQQISLSENDLTSLDANQFEALTNLRILWMSENDDLTTIPADVFDPLVNLREIQMSGHGLSMVHADQFARLSELRILNLTGTANSAVTTPNLTTLPDGLFDGLTNLQDLNLWGNELTALPENIFDDLTSLRYLEITNNDLATLRADAFEGLSDLRRLRLDFNNLTTLPAGVFDGLARLTELRLNHNSLTALSATVLDDLDSLSTLVLQFNDFTASTGLPAGVFDGVLDTLGDVVEGSSTVGPHTDVGLHVDGGVRAAHFVCSLGNANDIVAATVGVENCLRVTAVQLAAFANTFFADVTFVDGFGTGTDVKRYIEESSGSLLSATSDLGVNAIASAYSNVPSGTQSYTCVFHVGGTATFGVDWIAKEDADEDGSDDDDIPAADSRFSATTGIFTEPDCGPGDSAIRIINDSADEDDETIIITLVSVEAFDAANSGGTSLGFAAIEEPSTLTITIVEPFTNPEAAIVGQDADLQDDGNNSDSFTVHIRNYDFPSGQLDTLVVSLRIDGLAESGTEQEFVSSPTASADTDGAQSLDGNLFNLDLPDIAGSNGVTEANRPYLISSGGSGSFLLVVPEAFFATAGSGSDGSGADIAVNVAAADIASGDFSSRHTVQFSGNDGRGIFVAQGTSGVEVVETNAALNTIARSAATGNVIYTLVPAIEGPTASITTTGPIELIREDTTRMAVTFSASNLTLAAGGAIDTVVTFTGTITGLSGETDTFDPEEDFKLETDAANSNPINLTDTNTNTFVILRSGRTPGRISEDGAATATFYLDPNQSGSGNESFIITLTSVETCTNNGFARCDGANLIPAAEVVGETLRVDLTDPPTVSVGPATAEAVESGEPGIVTFTLSEADSANATTINFTATSTDGAVRGSCTLTGALCPADSTGPTYVLATRTGTAAPFTYTVIPTATTSITIDAGDTEYDMAVIAVDEENTGDAPETITITATAASGNFEPNAEAASAVVTAVDPGTTELRLVTGHSALAIGGRNDYTVNLDGVGVEVPAGRANADPIFNRSTGGEQIDAVFELEFQANPNFGPLPAIADLEGDPVLGTNAITGDNYDVFLRSGPVTSSANYDISLSGNVLRVVVKQSRLTGTSTSGGNAPGAERFIFSVIPKGVVGDTIIRLNAYTIVAGGDADDATDRRDTLNTSASGNTFSAVDAPTATLDRVSGFDGTIPTTADTNALELSFVNPLPEISGPEFAYTLSITPTGNDAVNTPFAGHFEITAPTPNVTVSEITEDGDARTVTITDSRGDTLDTLTDSADAFVALRVLPFTGGNRTFNIALTNVRVVSGSGPATRINATPSNDIAERQTTVSVAAFTGPTASINVTGPQTIELGDSAAGGADTTTFDVVLENIPAVDTNSDDVNIVRFTLDFAGTTATDPVDAEPDREITANSANNSASTLYYTVVGMDGATVTTPSSEDETVTFQYDDDAPGVDFVDGNGVRRTTFPFTLFSVDASTGVIVVKVSAISYFQADPSMGNAVTTPTVQLLDDDTNALNLAARTIAAVATGGAPSVSIVAGTDNDNIIREGTTTTDFTVELNNIPTFVARSTATFVDVELSADTANGSLSFNRTSEDGTITMGGAGEFTLSPPNNDTVFINTSDNSQTAVLRMPITTGGDDEATITIGAGSNLATADPFISLAPTGISWRMGTDGADAITGGPAVHRAGRQQFIVDTVDAAARIEADELTVIKGTNGEFTVTMEGFALANSSGTNIDSVRLALLFENDNDEVVQFSSYLEGTRTYSSASSLNVTFSDNIPGTPVTVARIPALDGIILLNIPRDRFLPSGEEVNGYEQVTFTVDASGAPVDGYTVEVTEASSYIGGTAEEMSTPDPGDLTLSVVDPLGATLTVNSGTSIAESTSATVADFVIAGIPPRANRPEETTAMRASFVISSTVNGSRVPLDSDDNLANFEWELIRDVDDLPEEFRATPTADICIPLIGNEATSRWDVAINREAAGDIWMGEEIVTIAVTGISYLESGDCASNPVSDVPDIPALTATNTVSLTDAEATGAAGFVVDIGAPPADVSEASSSPIIIPIDYGTPPTMIGAGQDITPDRTSISLSFSGGAVLRRLTTDSAADYTAEIFLDGTSVMTIDPSVVAYALNVALSSQTLDIRIYPRNTGDNGEDTGEDITITISNIHLYDSTADDADAIAASEASIEDGSVTFFLQDDPVVAPSFADGVYEYEVNGADLNAITSLAVNFPEIFGATGDTDTANIIPGTGAVADLSLVYVGIGEGTFGVLTCDSNRGYSSGDTIPVSQLDGCADPGAGVDGAEEGLRINSSPGTEVRFRLRNAAGLDSELITVTINHPGDLDVAISRSPPAIAAILTALSLTTDTADRSYRTLVPRADLFGITSLTITDATQTGDNAPRDSDLNGVPNVATLTMDDASNTFTSLPAGYLNGPLETLTTLTLPSTYQKAFMGFSPASAPIEPGGVTRISLQLRNEANTARASSPVVLIARLNPSDNLSLLESETGTITDRRSLFPRFNAGVDEAAHIAYDATHTGTADGTVAIVTGSLTIEQTGSGDNNQNNRSSVVAALVETGSANGLSGTITLDADTAPARSPRVTLTTDDPSEIPVGATATFNLTLENMPSCRNIGDVNRYLTDSACTGAGGVVLTGHNIGMEFPTGTFAGPFSTGTGPYTGDVDDDGTNDVEVSVGIFDSTALVTNPILLEFSVATGDLDDRGGITIPVTFTALAETDGEFTVAFPDGRIFPTPLAASIVASRYYSGQQDNAYLTFTAQGSATFVLGSTGAEGGVPASFGIQLLGAPDVATTINYRIPPLGPNDAIPNVDYVFTASGPGTTDFTTPTGNPTDGYIGTITIMSDGIDTNGDANIGLAFDATGTEDDNIVEGTETIRLMLPDGVPGVAYADPGILSRNLDDNDYAVAVPTLDGVVLGGYLNEAFISEGRSYPVQLFLVRQETNTPPALTATTVSDAVSNGTLAVLKNDTTFTLTLEAGGGTPMFSSADASLASTTVEILAGASSSSQTTLSVTADADNAIERFRLFVAESSLPDRVIRGANGNWNVDIMIPASTAVTGFCVGRTPAVRDLIFAQLTGIDDCDDADNDAARATKLAGITALDLTNATLTTLQPLDFVGLTGLTSLGLSGPNVNLRSLPATVFPADLDDLQTLDLSGNSLTTAGIPAGVFNELDALITLNLGDMDTLTALPVGVLDEVLDTLGDTVDGTDGVLTIPAAAKRFITFAEPNEYEVVQGGNVMVRLRITNPDGETATTPTAVFASLMTDGGFREGLTFPNTVREPDSVEDRNGIIIPAGSSGVDVVITAADDAANAVPGTPATLEFYDEVALTFLGIYDGTTFTWSATSFRADLVAITANSASDPITAEVNIVAPVQMMASDAAAAVRNNVPGAIDLTLNRLDTDVGTVDVSFGLSGGLAVGVDYTLDITRPDDSENGAPVSTGGTGNGLTGQPFTLADSATSGTFRLPDGASSATFTITPIASSPLRTADSSVIIEITTVDYNGDADPDAVSQTTPPEATVDVAGYDPAPAVAITPSSEDGNDGANGVNTQITEGLGSDDYAQFTVALTNAPNGEAVVTYNLAVSGQTDSVDFSGATSATSAITGVTFLDNIDGEVPTTVGNGQEFTMDVASGGAMGSLRFSARAGDGDRVNETVTLTITDVAFADNGDGTDISTSMLGEIRVIDSNQIDNICSRTDAVEARILAAVRTARSNGTLPCTDVMGNAPELSSIGSLTVTDVPGLLADDFAGLTGMTTLSLTGTFPTLPAGVFDQPTALTDLTINGALTSIPPGVFDRLTRLATLDLSGNDLRSVSGAVFGSTNTLQTLRILNLSGSTSLDITAGTLDAVLPRLTSLTWPTTRTASFDNVPTDISQTGTAPITVTLGDTNTLPVAVRIPITGNGPLSSTLTIPDAVIPAGTTSVVVIIAADTVVGTSGTISLGTPVLQTTPTAGDPADITTQNAGVRTALLRDPSGSQTLTFIEVTGPTARLTGSADTTLTRGDTATISVNLSNIDTIQNFTHVEVIMELGGTGIAGDLALVDADSVETSDYRIDITSGNVDISGGATTVRVEMASGSDPAALYVYVPVARFAAGVGGVGEAAGAETINYTLTVKNDAGFSRTLMPSLRFASNGTSAVQAVDANGEPIAMGDIAVSGTAPTYTIVAPATLTPITARISEGSSQPVTLTLHNGAPTANFTVPYTVAIVDPTAEPGEAADYAITPTGGVFTFANADDKVATIDVEAIQDFAVDTDGEGLTITLDAGTYPPANGFTIAAGEISSTLTIVSTDAAPETVFLSPAEVEVFESGSKTSADITVSLNVAALADATITVRYSITDGAAVINEDYEVTGDCVIGSGPCPATGGEIIFTEGMRGGTRGIMSRTITVAALGDDVDESDVDEMFTFELLSADGGVMLDPDRPTVATITIRERTVELEEVMMQVETVATVVATEHVSALTSLIRQRFSATSSFASPPRVPTGGIPAPSTTTNLSLADSPETMNDMINSMGLERSAQGDSNDHYAVWIRGQRSAFEGTPEVQGLTVNYDGTSTGVGMGAEYISGGYLMGLAMNYVTTEVDLSTEGGVGSESITKYDESIVIAAPYLSMKAGEGTSLWASVGYGTGTADAKLEDETKSADVSLSFLNAGADFTVIGRGFEVVTGLSGLVVRKVVDAFVFADTVIPKTTIDTMQAVGEVTIYRPIPIAGQFVRPYMGISTIHDLGDIVADDDHGLGIRTGVAFGVGRISADIELSSELLRENRRQWTVSGGARFAARPGGQGLSLSLDGTQETQMDAGESVSDDVARTWGVGLEGGYGMPAGLFHPNGLLTPFASIDQTGNGRGMSGGVRFSVGNGLSLDLETTKQMHDDGEDASENKAGLRGQWSF